MSVLSAMHGQAAQLGAPSVQRLLRGDCILEHYPDACDKSFNALVIEYTKDVMKNDPRYKRSKQVHTTKQAGVYHVGQAFHYRNEKFDSSPIPPPFDGLKAVAERLSGKQYDTVLLKVYGPGESLANHQDVDGSNMSVACFTFYNDASSECKLEFYKYSGKLKPNGKPNYSYKPRRSFTPRSCSMWFMSGSTNSKYSHRVLPAESGGAEGLRVSVSFRQSSTTSSLAIGTPVSKSPTKPRPLKRNSDGHSAKRLFLPAVQARIATARFGGLHRTQALSRLEERRTSVSRHFIINTYS